MRIAGRTQFVLTSTLGGVVAGALFLAVAWSEHRPRSVAAADAAEMQRSPDEVTGITAAAQSMGRELPTGKGIPFAHVEGNPGDYLPDLKAENLAGLTLVPMSGASKLSAHAGTTSRILYGAGGMAPGVTNVHFYNVQHWIEGGCLRVGTDQPPLTDDRRVMTHSWIGPAGSGVEDVLRRVDWVVEQHDTIVCVGVNNGAKTPVPAMLASGYNSIAVGEWHGNSSGGYTKVDGGGRCKPDIVGPGTLTSYSTPIVAGVCARLLETADALRGDANKSEVIKAVLLAGAEKTGHWSQQEGHPLDEHLGAGMVRFDWSEAILKAGEQRPDAPLRAHGWDFAALNPKQAADYRIDTASIAEDKSKGVGEISIILTWHRRIDGRRNEDLLNHASWDNTPRLADFDLVLTRSDAAKPEVIATSASTVDNVEHIHLTDLPPGKYTLSVVRKSDGLSELWDYALAWRIDK